MLTYFPKYFTNRAIILYFIALGVVTLVWFNYALEWYFMLFGAVEVCVFFYFGNQLILRWNERRFRPHTFAKRLFGTAFAIRVVYVIFSYFFYIGMTGQPFEFATADAKGYHEAATWFLEMGLSRTIQYLFHGARQIADAGYPFYLYIFYSIFGSGILLVRLVKAIFSAWTCVLIYKVASRNFGESTGRMAAVFCMLMPTLIYYCGFHLKEPEMIFIATLFVERADLLLRTSKFKISLLISTLLSALCLFLFRTVLGAIALSSLLMALVLSSPKMVGGTKKIAFVFFAFIFIVISAGSTISQEVERVWEGRSDNQSNRIEERQQRMGGNPLLNYVSAAVFAPMIFTLPFPTMIATEEQEDMHMINGGNFVKGLMSFFVIFALISLLLNGEWRQHILLIAFMCGYLLVIAFSAFAQSGRFHMPVLPFMMLFAAYGISQFKNTQKRWYIMWLASYFVIIIAWQWFKLKGRGMI